MDELSERIEACIAAENATADVYNTFSNKFPEARDFFRELSKEEENHAVILVVGRGYQRIGRLPNHAVPKLTQQIYDTLASINNIKKEIESQDISLKEALMIALSMERLTAESYIQETLTGETDSDVINKLQKLLVDERSHTEKIKEFMLRRGLGEEE